MNKKPIKKNKKPINITSNTIGYISTLNNHSLFDGYHLNSQNDVRLTNIESTVNIDGLDLKSIDSLLKDNMYLHAQIQHDPLWTNNIFNKKILSLLSLYPKLSKLHYFFQKEIAEFSIGEDSFDPNEAWIQTNSGKRLTPLNPKIKSITIDDIAHALSMQCRFTGHSNEFYSVAQHCVYVSYMCDYNDRLHGLLHDGSEAYICDFSAPLKRSGKFDNYVEVEKKLQSMIYNRFGLSEIEPESVKYADKLMLYTEARDLIERRPDWESKMEPAPFKIQPLGPKEAKQQFLSRFYDIIIDMYLAKNKNE